MRVRLCVMHVRTLVYTRSVDEGDYSQTLCLNKEDRDRLAQIVIEIVSCQSNLTPRTKLALQQLSTNT